MREFLRLRLVSSFVAVAPIFIGALLVQASEPFPHDMLHPSNPQFWANVLRVCTFFSGGVILGLIAYVMALAIRAETTVSGGHPRVLLYQHVSYIAFGHGVLIVGLLFFIRERINQPLSPATPVVVLGLVLTTWALVRMLAYQNSRLRRHHSAKQVLGRVIAVADRDLCLRVSGSEEEMALVAWLDEYTDGDLVRLTVEKIEEAGSVPMSRRWWFRGR